MPDKAALDMLVKAPAPAISADGSRPDAVFMQTAEQQAEIAEENKKAAPAKEPVEAKKADATEVKPEKADEAPPKPEPEKDDTPAPIKREFTKLRNKAREADERAAKLETRLDQALKALENSSGKTPTKAQTGEDDPRPQRTKFTDPDEYENAVDGWHKRETARVVNAELAARDTKAAKADQERKQKEYVASLQKDWTEARDEIIAEHPDYEALAEAEDLFVSEQLGAALINTRKEGPRLAYWLAQNKDELERLNAMTGQQAAYELGRIADRLTAKPMTEKRPAAPLRPINGSKGAAVKDRNDPRNYDMEARLSEMRQKNRPFLPVNSGRPN